MSDEIPLATEVIRQEDNENLDAPPEQVEEEYELTEEEKQAREAVRTELVTRCRDYVLSYVEKKAPGKIRYRANVLKMNNSYIFRYSPPAKRGQRTDYFSQVVINRDNNECRLEYFRPRRHDKNLWYFPIYYMMNGFTKNPVRTFQALGIEPVQNLVKQTFEDKGYRVQFMYNRRIGNVVCVEWGQEKVVEQVEEKVVEQLEEKVVEQVEEKVEEQLEEKVVEQVKAEQLEAKPAPLKTEKLVELEPKDGVPATD